MRLKRSAKLFLVTVALLMVSCLSRTVSYHPYPSVKGERTTWPACIPEDGAVVLPSDYSWDRITCTDPAPFKLKIGGVFVFDDRLRGQVRRAVYQWNLWIGEDILRVVEEPIDADVFIRYTPEKAWWWGYALPWVNKGKPLCLITISDTGINRWLERTMAHEIGHCLGLAHDNWPRTTPQSVMNQGEKTWDYSVTTADRNALRKLWLK